MPIQDSGLPVFEQELLTLEHLLGSDLTKLSPQDQEDVRRHLERCWVLFWDYRTKMAEHGAVLFVLGGAVSVGLSRVAPCVAFQVFVQWLPLIVGGYKAVCWFLDTRKNQRDQS